MATSLIRRFPRVTVALHPGSCGLRLSNDDHRRSFSGDATTVTVSIEEAQSTTARALEKIGWDASDAALQAEIMTAAELCGNNQGLVKMYQPKLMAPSPDAGKPTIERETASSAVVNAHQAPGMLAAVTAADLAVSKCNPISIVSSYNTSTSSGQLAFYVERMSRKGYVSLAMANSPEFVAPASGAKPRFGTNPLAVGLPRSSGPPFTVRRESWKVIIMEDHQTAVNPGDYVSVSAGSTHSHRCSQFDMATSAIALFGLLTSKAQGTPLPEQVAYDKEGKWTTDAASVLEGGAIATFGGHKGAGLALCVELLAGALSGGAVLGQVESKKVAKSWGHTFICIDPKAMVDDYETKVDSILGTLSSDGVRIPGERSARTAEERKAAGTLPIPIKIWESIVHTAEHGLPDEK